MFNKAGTILIFIGIISFLSAYNNASTKTVTSEEFACEDLAALDKRCAGAGAVVSVPPQVHNEMNDLSKSYWSQYLCKKNGSYYVSIKHPINNLLYELKEVRFKGTTFEQTPADKLNNVEQTGVLSVDAITSRQNSDGKWNEWMNYKPYLKVGIEKINGQWQADNQDRYIPVDCSNLPQ